MNRKLATEADSAVVGDRKAKLIAHLVREHMWDEWDLTELDAVGNLHSELHEQLPLNHAYEELPAG